MKKIFLLSFIFTGVFALSACGTSESAVQTAIVQTQLAQPTSTIMPDPTETYSPTPTETPVVTPTPQFQKWQSTNVVDAFLNAGLEAANPYPMTKDDFGAAPYVASEGTRFFIPSLCDDCGGRILSFETQDDLNITKAYYEELGKSSALFYSWVFVKDNILVQINGDLPEDQATQYKNALESLK